MRHDMTWNLSLFLILLLLIGTLLVSWSIRIFPRRAASGRPPQVMPWLISVGLIIAGLTFSAYSSGRHSSSSETHWGYTLTGLTCLLLGTAFAYLIWSRDVGIADARPSKWGPQHPLE
jgi:hypothetical protein